MSARSKRGRVSPDPPRKKAKSAPSPSATAFDDDEDSLESILAQIRAQEESEALARKLEEEWNASASTSSRALGSSGAKHCQGPSGDVIELSDGPDVEDDEAFARRLAREWESEDIVEVQPPLSAHRSRSPINNSKSCEDARPPPANKLAQHKDLFIGERTCCCGEKHASPRGHVTFTPEYPPSSLVRLLHFTCKKCKGVFCRGCMSRLSCRVTCKGDDAECSVQTCCGNIRILALYEALSGFDILYLGERETSEQRARAAAARFKETVGSSVGPGGTGYGMGAVSGQYGHWQPPRSRRRGRGRGAADNVPASRQETLTTHFDQLLIRALNTITNYLPAPYSDDPQIYDMLPHTSIDALLSLSQLPDLLGNLLRNDSVIDWIPRIEVYHAMLKLLRRMADCELTLEVLIRPRWEMTKSCGLEEWMWDEGEIVWERELETHALVQGLPLYAHFKKLTKQCETFLTGASGMLESEAADDGSETAETALKAMSLCGDIIAAKDDIERAMNVMGKDPAAILGDSLNHESSSTGKGKGSGRLKGKGRDPIVDLERTYGRECERLAFKYVTLSQPSKDGPGLEYPEYNYGKELNLTANSTRNPKDRLHLVKELAVMATSLPPGVWVRVDEVRNDAIKIMIAGPEGTPYAGGLFEFDCFIPLEYPNKPPLMHLRTTGGGSVRFNPNLYNCGKVCLSLLGTWPGRPEEQWSPKSTLLQVVVSIQSMILIEAPYFNEPGYGKADPKSAASIGYNKNICMQTTRWAIVDWLQDQHKDGVWGEVIASHFLTRQDVIKKCIQEWSRQEPAIRYYQSAFKGYGTEMMIPPLLPMGAFMGMPAPPPYSAHPAYDMMPMTVAPSSHAHSLRSGKNAAANTQSAAIPMPQNLDLLEEYDKGMARVRTWVFDHEGQQE